MLAEPLRCAIVVGLALVATGCPAAAVCGAHSEDLFQADGGVYRCTLAEDCPRPANAAVCVTDALSDRECVSCQSTRCVRTIPEFCQ